VWKIPDEIVSIGQYERVPGPIETALEWLVRKSHRGRLAESGLKSRDAARAAVDLWVTAGLQVS
jgi:hypothetical protein